MHISLNGINIHIQANLFPLLLFSGGALLSRALPNAMRSVCVMLTLLGNNWCKTEKGEQKSLSKTVLVWAR